MDVLNEWLKEHRNVETIMDGIKRDCVIERIVCKDGYSFSCQVNEYAYCNPRKSGAFPYSSVEIGFPSDGDSLINAYAENHNASRDEDGFIKTVYGYVPIKTVTNLIKKHGGFENGPSTADIDILNEGYKIIKPRFGKHITYVKHITNHIVRVIDINKSTLEIKCYRKHIMGDIKYSVMTKAEKRLFNAKLEEIGKRRVNQMEMKNKIYVVYGETYYGEYGSYVGLFGVFSSKELAEKAKIKMVKELFEKNKNDDGSYVTSIDDIEVYIEEIEEDKMLDIYLGGYAE